MDGYFINIHFRAKDVDSIKRSIISVFEKQGFKLTEDAPAAEIVGDDSQLPEDDTRYGLVISGLSNGWISAYVDDWQDSGLLAKEISRRLQVPTLEIWASENVQWGYTYFVAGEVWDRFGNDPAAIADSPAEEKKYIGNPVALADVLVVPPVNLETVLRQAQQEPDEFVSGSISEVCDTVGLPYEHALIGYEDFFETDPEDYQQDLTDWPSFRHLYFIGADGKEKLAE
jgi:hypothetical protein